MNSFLTEWDKDLKSIPVGPLGIIAMAGCEEMGKKVNSWLQKWNSLQESQDEEFYTIPGLNRDLTACREAWNTLQDLRKEV